MIFKTEDLISSIKLRAMVPISQQTFTESNLISLLNEELQVALVPEILSVRESYFMRNSRTPLVGGQSEYTLPKRAIGNALKDMFLISNPGTDYEERKGLSQIKISKLADSQVLSDQPSQYYIRGEKAVLVPYPSTSRDYLEFWYYSRPSDLVLTSTCAKITGITVSGYQVTFQVDTDLSLSLSTSSLIDFCSASSPNTPHSEDVVIRGIGPSSVVVNLNEVSDGNGTVYAQEGDYICLAGKTNIPQIPVELHPILAQQVAARLVEALGDQNKIQMVNGKLQEMRQMAFKLISNRVENDPILFSAHTGTLHHSKIRSEF